MKKKLFMSVASLVTVLAVGVTSTFALISSNTATISASEIDTGNASIKLCSRVDNLWETNIAGFKLSGILPGDTDKDITNGTNIFVGNDNGGLAGLDSCAYGATASTSNVNMKLIPLVTVTNSGASCTTQAQNDIQLRFQVGSTDSGYGSLAFWATNTNQYGDVINVNSTAQLQIFAKMDQTSTQTNQQCQFNVSLTGVQQP